MPDGNLPEGQPPAFGIEGSAASKVAEVSCHETIHFPMATVAILGAGICTQMAAVIMTNCGKSLLLRENNLYDRCVHTRP